MALLKALYFIIIITLVFFGAEKGLLQGHARR